MASIQESEGGWVARKPRQLGGISDALSIASDLGFSVRYPPSKFCKFIDSDSGRIKSEYVSRRLSFTKRCRFQAS
ncbi:hypothetical protein L1887_17799 [Cichorium endivia]|nr:hypothetical protein L1887_17799 [Cichorium endivia]